MRDHPDGVRSVVLDSTYPPEVDGVASIPAGAERALSELFAACAADPTCVETFGDLEALLFGLIDELNVTPITITVTDFFTADRYPALIAGDDVLDLVFQALYSEDFLVEIPEMLDDIRSRQLSLDRVPDICRPRQPGVLRDRAELLGSVPRGGCVRGSCSRNFGRGRLPSSGVSGGGSFHSIRLRL